MAQTQSIEHMTRRRFDAAVRLLEKTRLIRRKITARSGKWDAVRVIHDIRYAK